MGKRLVIVGADFSAIAKKKKKTSSNNATVSNSENTQPVIE